MAHMLCTCQDGLSKLESRMSLVEDRSHKNAAGIDSCAESIDAVSKRVATNKFNIDAMQQSVKSQCGATRWELCGVMCVLMGDDMRNVM